MRESNKIFIVITIIMFALIFAFLTVFLNVNTVIAKNSQNIDVNQSKVIKSITITPTVTQTPIPTKTLQDFINEVKEKQQNDRELRFEYVKNNAQSTTWNYIIKYASYPQSVKFISLQFGEIQNDYIIVYLKYQAQNIEGRTVKPIAVFTIDINNNITSIEYVL